MSDEKGNNTERKTETVINNKDKNEDKNEDKELLGIDDDNLELSLSSEVAGKDWRQPYPGPADRNFHYRKLLVKSPNGIGDAAGRDDLKVAIIGTGAAGLTAAHELARSGLKNIDMFEATERYGGRLWTETLNDNQDEKQFTVMDMGAMRMPPFIPKQAQTEEIGSAKRQRQIWKDGNSILSYYLQKHLIRTSEFPNPGSKYCKSGIYYNEGSIQPISSTPAKESIYLDADESNENEKLDKDKLETKGKEKSDKKNTDYVVHNKNEAAKGQMLIWNEDEDAPPNEELRIVADQWAIFSKRIKDQIEKYYDTIEWPAFWRNIVRNYYNKSFRQVVRDPALLNEDNILTGDFGGVGLNEEQARIMFVIGVGDGGWGAFYNISFLYVYRVILHGYGKDHQLIEGLFHNNGSEDNILENDEPADGRQMIGNKQGFTVRDSLKIAFKPPEYLGLHSIPDSLLFGRLHIEDEDVEMKEEPKNSIYDNLKKPDEDGYHLFLNSPVSKIEKLKENGKVRLHVKNDVLINEGYKFDTEYDAVIITVPTHQFGMEIEVTGFDEKMWPYSLQAYLSQAYWIPCAKVFLELKNAYWLDKECRIPQVIASETFIRDTYGIKVNRGSVDKQTGVLLISYTWTRDATKLISYTDQELINMCVKELDRMLANCKNIREKDRISTYAQTDGYNNYGDINYKGKVHHWELKQYYKGAARFYDPLGWDNIRVPMAYNQERSMDSKLYFAGEAYHADAGWVEPAFRSAIDAVLHFFKNNKIDLKVGDQFDFDKDYAKYETFDPTTPATTLTKR
ncbi:MAG: FAD-dependent oxidoreductase [Sneathiella sp.]